MEGRCIECGCQTLMHHYIEFLCYNCHEKLIQNKGDENNDKRK